MKQEQKQMNKMEKRLRTLQGHGSEALRYSIIFFIIILWLEGVLYLAYNVAPFVQKSIYIIVYSIILGALATLPRKRAFINLLLSFFTIIITVLYAAEATFFHAFNSIALLDDLSNMKELNGVKDSITDFISWHIILFIVPLFIAFIVILYTRKIQVKKNNNKKALICLVAGLLLLVTSDYVFSYIQNDTNKVNFLNSTLHFKKYGLLSTLNKEVSMKISKQNTMTEQIDEMEESFRYESLPHELTAHYEGKNLVFIQAESIAPYGIDEQLTPNMYKLQQEGYNFTNFYSPRPNTNYSEYSFLKSFHLTHDRDMKLLHSDGSMPTLFKEKGYIANAFHNNFSWFYSRDKKMLEIGFDKFYASEDLDLEVDVVSDYISDFDLFVESYPFFRVRPEILEGEALENDNVMEELEETEDVDTAEAEDKTFNEAGIHDETSPFFSYLITVSAHVPFDVTKRPSIAENYAEVEKIYPEYPNNIKAYLAGAMLTDAGIGNMLDSLESDGLLDDTVIVLVGDHYPYGLGEDTIKKMYKIDGLDTYKVPFIIWDASQPSQEIDTLGSNVDVLPTVSELFNLNLDYTMGQDLFSDNSSKVIVDWFDVRSYSFLTPQGGYDGETFTGIGNLSSKELAEYEALTYQRNQWVKSRYVDEKLKR